MTNTLQNQRSPLSLLLLIIILSLGTYILSPAIFMAIGVGILGISPQEFLGKISMSEPEPAIQIALVLIQGASAILSFIVVPAIFISKLEYKGLKDYFHSKNISIGPIFLAACLTFSLMVVNSLLIEWNMNIEFPDFVADSFDQMEEQGRIMTEYLTDFFSLPYFIVVMVVVAVVPALGEEFLFRGLIQKYLNQISQNPHLAIWITAALFSAFHLQFYGFFPRMALGAFFGYLFYFSGNLWYAVIGHFLNNGFTLLMIYLFQIGVVDQDIENVESISIWSAMAFVIIGGVLFVLFKKQFHITDNLQNE